MGLVGMVASTGGAAMPLFEYRCPKCKHQLEKLVSGKDRDKLPRCPKCKEPEMQKLVSRSSFALKGGGWADDGYSS